MSESEPGTPAPSGLPTPRGMWVVCSFSPLAYLGIAILLEAVFLRGERRALFGAGADWGDRLVPAMIAIAAAAQAAMGGLLYKRHARGGTRSVQMLMLAAAELPVFSGFVLWTLTGDLRCVFWLGVASMILYAQAHPGWQDRGMRLGRP